MSEEKGPLGILPKGPIRQAIAKKKLLPQVSLGENSVDINAYVSKIRFNLDRKTITVYGKEGRVLWGVSAGP